jgi:hypothetical protein
MIRRYLAYLFRWQLSTPILWGVVGRLGPGVGPTVLANLVGGLIFFWVDRFIFTSKLLAPQWEVHEQVHCADCGITARGYRLVKTKNYDRTGSKPEFRCEHCSQNKVKELRNRGVDVE